MTPGRAFRNRWARTPGVVGGIDVRVKYFLSGFGRCSECGGSMHPVNNRQSMNPETRNVDLGFVHVSTTAAREAGSRAAQCHPGLVFHAEAAGS